MASDTSTNDPTQMHIPNWYCPYKIPADFIGSVPPLVCLSGLNVEKNQTHRAIWEMIKLKPSSKDFKPTYANVPLSHKFPEKKPKHEPLETYTPLGILKSNWLEKHMQTIPSVLVVFFDMNWTDPYWNERKNECAERVRTLKKDLLPHGTQVLVMLIKTADAGEDNFSTDRASALCAAADIPPKALYILSHTHSERIQACVQRLEIGMKEASKVYYSARIRRVKNWKDRTSDLGLLTRYNFKIAFFQEIRRDYVSALSHYQAAFDAIRSLSPTECIVQQVRCVSSWISYRICRLNLLKMDYKESLSHFEKHIRYFRKLTGHPDTGFEQMAWLQQQYNIFGELLRHYYRPGLTSLDPVTYFLTAVNYAEKRVQYTNKHLKDENQWPSEMKEFLGDCKLEYVGQRPWRKDELTSETTLNTPHENANSVNTLKICEQSYRHSNDKITLLGTASDFCRDQQRLRTRCQLMMMMGVEFFAQMEYQRCIMLMTHVLREFGRDKGTALLYLVAECGLRAAFCSADVPSYLSFLIFLLKRDFRAHLKQNRNTLWNKYLSIMQQKIPEDEAGCKLDEEKWSKALVGPHISYVGVHTEGIIDAVFSFANDTFRAGSSAEVKVVLRNQNHAEVRIRKFGAGISIVDYNCEAALDLCLQPGETHELSLFFTPLTKDVGKIIQLHMGYIDIGRKETAVILHYSVLTSNSPYLWNEEKKEKGEQIIAKIEPMIPLLVPKILHEERILVNEWHKVRVTWTNSDTCDYTKVNLTFLLSASDPSDLILTTDPTKSTKRGHLTHSVDSEVLEPGGSIELVVFVKCWSPIANDIKFITKAKYLDGLSQPVANELVEPVEIIQPFNTMYETKNLQNDDVLNILSSEEFIVNFLIKNASKCNLLIEKVRISKTQPTVELYVTPGSETADMVLKIDEVVSQMATFRLLAPTDSTLCQFEITWRRENQAVPSCTSTVPISPVTFTSTPSIYVEGVYFSKGIGELKKPMQVKFCIHNRSNKLYNLGLCMDSSECFMNAGPKKNNLKLSAFETLDVHYVLFPLKTGLLKTPRLLLDHNDATADVGSENPSIIHRNVVRYIFVARPAEEELQPQTLR